MPRHPSRELIREGVAVLGLALLYYAGARFGLLLAIDRTNSTPVWPPAGIALAGMLLLGRRVWPAVAMGAFIANWVAFSENHAATTPWVIGASALIACGNTLEALAGWWLCARWLAPGGRAGLGVKDEILFGRMSVFHFAGVAFLASVASAMVGPMVVCLSGIAPWKHWPLVSFTWWVGDATGILYVTPLLLGLARPTRAKWPPWKLGESTLAFAALLLACWAVFFAIGDGSQAVALKFVCMAPLIWIALRIGLMGTVVGIFVLALSAVLNTRFRVGPLVSHSEVQILLLLLAYLWVVGVTSLTLARSVAVQQQVQASLRAKQAELELITGITPVMLTRCSRDLRYVFVNRAYADRFGMTPEEIVGQPIRAVMGEEAYQTIRPHVESVLEGVAVEYEAEVPYERIGTRTIRVAYVPDKDAQGRVVGWFSSIFDLTEQRRLEERFRLAVQAAPCGMLMVDPEGRIVLANQHVEKLLGYRGEELIGRPVEMLVPERFRKQHPLHRNHYAHSPSSRPMGAGRDLYALRKDGSEVPVEIGLSPIRTEQGTMILNSIVDITERKNAEKAMQRLNEELEARVTARTAALGQANEKLNREIAERQRLEKQLLDIAEQEQRRFGQELHEGLGQELAGIGFLCNVLAEKLRGESHPEAPAIAELSKLLQGSLDSTRNLARTSYPVELENSGLLAALEGLADRTDGLFNIRCTVRCDWPRMFTLPDHMGIHLYRVVQEAVTNAIKHGHPQNILIECRTALGARTITVTDDGEGFAPPSGSAGMGLHLMRYRAQIVGAELTVCRAGERGCVVTCTIPTRV